MSRPLRHPLGDDSLLERCQPLPHEDCFTIAHDVPVRNGQDTFRVYEAGVDHVQATFVLLHGGGFTGVSWALVARQLAKEYNVLALDLRGHGATVTSDDNDMSNETLIDDVALTIAELFTRKERSVPPIIIAGHSLGGALAVRVANSGKLPQVRGVCVLDVVEGTALAALKHMRTIVASMPERFPSLAHAIAWVFKSGGVRNLASSRISVPSRFVAVQSEGGAAPSGGDGDDVEYKWRANLLATETHWRSWFVGLSSMFLGLGAGVSKLLLLAGRDRLDKQLMIGQMQGKFQMKLLPEAGHAVHEDSPDATAKTLLEFAHRNGIGYEAPVFVPKRFPIPRKTPQE